MRSAKQIAAGRANGQKSRGPRTPAGKAAEYHERHNPSNPEEHILVETLIANEWRLRRIESQLWMIHLYLKPNCSVSFQEIDLNKGLSKAELDEL